MTWVHDASACAAYLEGTCIFRIVQKTEIPGTRGIQRSNPVQRIFLVHTFGNSRTNPPGDFPQRKGRPRCKKTIIGHGR